MNKVKGGKEMTDEEKAELAEEENNVGILFKKSYEELEKENAELKAQIEKMKNFVESMYEANKNDAYCREYLGTILNEWS